MDVKKAGVVECQFSDIRDIFAAHHYKGARIGGGSGRWRVREPGDELHALAVVRDAIAKVEAREGAADGDSGAAGERGKS